MKAGSPGALGCLSGLSRYGGQGNGAGSAASGLGGYGAEAFGAVPFGGLDVLVRGEAFVELVDREHDQEVQGAGEEEEADGRVEEGAVGELGGAYGEGLAAHVARGAGGQPDEWGQEGADEAVHHGGERRPDDDADCQVDHVAAQDETAEALHLLTPKRFLTSTSGTENAASPPPPTPDALPPLTHAGSAARRGDVPVHQTMHDLLRRQVRWD